MSQWLFGLYNRPAMPTIYLTIRIDAPIERIFDLSRSIDLHASSMGRHKEKAVGGICTGLINVGQDVTWCAIHFGFRQYLTSRITALERPYYFRDSMVKGAFKRFNHNHYFIPIGDTTTMIDVFNYTSPLGPLGFIVDLLFLKAYMTRLLRERNKAIKAIAQSGEYTKYLHAS